MFQSRLNIPDTELDHYRHPINIFRFYPGADSRGDDNDEYILSKQDADLRSVHFEKSHHFLSANQFDRKNDAHFL